MNVVTGGPAAGAALVDDPDVACIAFTGSTAVGTENRERAAAQLKRVNLELGGIDPLIVFEDADLDVAVPGAAWARFLNNGQVLHVRQDASTSSEADRSRAFIERFVAHTRSLRVGNGMDPDVDLGPLISGEGPRARGSAGAARAGRWGAAARGADDRLDAGPGWFYAPTVLTDVDRDATRSSARKCSGRSRRSRSRRMPTTRSRARPARTTAWARTSTRRTSPGR